jgi:hypothetical protein
MPHGLPFAQFYPVASEIGRCGRRVSGADSFGFRAGPPSPLPGCGIVRRIRDGGGVWNEPAGGWQASAVSEVYHIGACIRTGMCSVSMPVAAGLQGLARIETLATWLRLEVYVAVLPLRIGRGVKRAQSMAARPKPATARALGQLVSGRTRCGVWGADLGAGCERRPAFAQVSSCLPECEGGDRPK